MLQQVEFPPIPSLKKVAFELHCHAHFKVISIDDDNPPSGHNDGQ